MKRPDQNLNKNEFWELEKRDDIAIVWLDHAGEKINKISPASIESHQQWINELQMNDEISAIILISRKKDFIAGADLKFFRSVKNKETLLPIIQKGHDLLNQIESSQKPVIAAIHGACLGGGTEIALACTARIIANDSSTHMALPEVQLGLLPGGGGTQRLPKLIGIQNALDMLLTGKKIYAHKAHRIGLADKAHHREGLLQSAISFAHDLIKNPIRRKDKRTTVSKLLEGNRLTRNIIFRKARQISQFKTKGNYPAVPRIIDCVEAAFNRDRKDAYQLEANNFTDLVFTNVSKQLINIFFAMTEKKKNPYPDLSRQVGILGMIGAGFMGAGIAEISISKGIKVMLKDISQKTISSAKATVWKSLQRKVRQRSLKPASAEIMISRISSQPEFPFAMQPDMVIEAVFEELELKQQVLHDFETAHKEPMIFASNTSAIPIKKIAADAVNPELVIGMHYFSPAPKMPLLEIVVTDQTADWVTATCFELGIRQGKTCIVVSDGPGFYTTRILAPYLNEALLLIEDGADALEIDRAMTSFGFPVGPLALIDEIGIDVGAHVMSGELMNLFMQRPGAKKSNGLKKMFEDGFSGRKNKKGFYEYDKKGGKVRGKINQNSYRYFEGRTGTQFSKNEIIERIAYAMINEAAMCLEEGVVKTPLDGDLGAILGLGFPPFTGGPFRFIDQVGIDQIADRLHALSEKLTDRFKPCKILLEKSNNQVKFYNQ